MQINTISRMAAIRRKDFELGRVRFWDSEKHTQPQWGSSEGTRVVVLSHSTRHDIFFIKIEVF